MTRVAQGRSAILSQTFEVDGTAQDPAPDSATVTITRDDGTVLVAGAAAVEGGTGRVTYTLTPSDTALLDVLTVEWTAVFGGVAQVFVGFVEVVGGFLFTIAQARALSPLSNTVAYTTAAIVDARTMVETAIEEACGVAFVPRYRRERVNGTGRSTLLLRPRLRTVRSLSVDDSAVTQAYLDTIRVLPTGEAYYPSVWRSGYANLDVAYEHGYDSPPPRVSQACLLYAKNFLVKGPIDDRTTSLSSEDGTYALQTPGLRGSWTGIPEVDAVIQQYSLECGVA